MPRTRAKVAAKDPLFCVFIDRQPQDFFDRFRDFFSVVVRKIQFEQTQLIAGHVQQRPHLFLAQIPEAVVTETITDFDKRFAIIEP